MQHTTQINSNSPASFTSGYGVVMEQEHELQSSTRKAWETVDGPRASDVGRILRRQGTLLGENITRLEQLFGSLPHADRFQALHRVLPPLSKTPHAASPEHPEMLPVLVTQHLNVTTNINKLRAHSHDGEGDADLVEVARNHDEMARALTSLIMEHETARRQTVTPDDGGPAPETAENQWENEGGALQARSSTGTRWRCGITMTPLRGATLGIFACAFIAILLRLMQVVPAANMVPHVLVAATMILALLTIVDESD